MRTITRHTFAGAVCGALFLVVSTIPASATPAASGMQSVGDPSGRYTITFPASWEVVSLNATPLAGQIVSHLGKNFVSMLMAIDPSQQAGAPTVLLVIGVPLEAAVSPRTFGMMTAESMSDKIEGYALVKEGMATIADRPAFYRYFTMQQKGETLYSVVVYFTVGKTGYMIFGATRNQPETVRKSFGDISQILETFRPTGK